MVNMDLPKVRPRTQRDVMPPSASVRHGGTGLGKGEGHRKMKGGRGGVARLTGGMKSSDEHLVREKKMKGEGNREGGERISRKSRSESGIQKN